MNRSRSSQLIDSAAAKLQSLMEENKDLLFYSSYKSVVPYFCHYCRVETKNRHNHQEHIKSADHEKKQKERESALSDAVESMFRAARTPILQSSSPLPLCSVCMLPNDQPKKHKGTNRHMAMQCFLRTRCHACSVYFLNRIQFEKHHISLSHIKHVIFKKINRHVLSDADVALLKGEQSDDPKGTRYVTDYRGFHCKICDEYFTFKSSTVNTHCKSDEHMKKLKQFIKMKKEDLFDEGGDELDDDEDDVPETNGKESDTNSRKARYMNQAGRNKPPSRKAK